MLARRRAWVVSAAAVVVIAAAAVGLARRRAERARAPAAISLELTYDVLCERAAETAFQRALDRLVRNLGAAGQRIGAVLPEPRAARLLLPGLAEPTLRQALEGLPITAGAASPSGEVRVALADDELARTADAALQETARRLRERAIAAHPCDGCVPVVVIHGSWRDARLILRLPWIDDIAERRLRAAIDAPPALPAPLSFAGEKLVRDATSTP